MVDGLACAGCRCSRLRSVGIIPQGIPAFFSSVFIYFVLFITRRYALQARQFYDMPRSRDASVSTA